MDTKEFVNPAHASRGVALWMLNDRLEKGEIIRQLDGIAAAGWGAVITRTFNGLRTQYLGQEWMDLTSAVIDRAEQLGLRVWLQAGYMPGAIPKLDPSRAQRGLQIHPKSYTPASGQTRLAADGDYVYCEHLFEGVLDLLNPDSVNDYLNLAYRDPWYSRFSRHFGKTIEAIWVDEPHFRPPLLPWSAQLPGAFQERWGYDLLQRIPSLFRAVGDHRQVRHHYWRSVLDLFLKGYFEPVGQWCRDHHVKFSGHLMGEDTLHSQIGWTVATMPCYEAMQLPGIDHLTKSLSWPTGKPFILTPKQASSAASQLGKSEVLAEMYGVSSQGISFADRKQIAAWMFALGINTRCYHGAFYSMRGRRKRIYVPHLSHQQPWWPDNHLIADPMARLSWALRRGRSMARVLVLHPVESAFCLYDPLTMERPHDRSSAPPAAHEMDTRLVTLCNNLLGLQRDFELGDETLMAKHGEATAGGLRIGQMTYGIVILPDLLTIRRTTLELLERFAASGGAVVSRGALPARMDGFESSEVAARLQAIVRLPSPLDTASSSLRAVLDAIEPPLVQLAASSGQASDVWARVRRVEDGLLIYLTNISASHAVTGDMTLRAVGALEAWDLSTGQIQPAPNRPDRGATIIPLDLPPLAIRLLLLRDHQPPHEMTRAPWRTIEQVPFIDGEAHVQRDAPNALTLDLCRWRKPDTAWSEPTPPHLVQKILEEEKYNGPITLQFQFQADVPIPGLQVAIEDAAEYEICVNGHAARYEGLPHYIDQSFHPVAIGAFVNSGANTIELTRAFRPVGKPSLALAALFEVKEGTELEAIYLVGDFAVRGERSAVDPPHGCVRFMPNFVLTTELKRSGGDLCADGYPFYAGRIRYTRKINLRAPVAGERVLLTFDGVNAALAKVQVNGHDAGVILWPPYEVEITPHIVAGDNEIVVELVSTLRNLLGPHHRGSGEPSHTWHVAFDSPPDHNRRMHPEDSDPAWTDNYLMIRFGISGEMRVLYQHQ